MISTTVLEKFNSSPGTMSIDELEQVGVFLKAFKEYYSRYTEATHRQDYEGVCYNGIQADIDKNCWYLNFKGNN